jgi:hypothetical protein
MAQNTAKLGVGGSSGPQRPTLQLAKGSADISHSAGSTFTRLVRPSLPFPEIIISSKVSEKCWERLF